jgi:transcriptional antiterminator RfaH
VNAITAVDIQPTAGLASLSPADHTGCRCNSGWVVAVTHPQAEIWANNNLTRRGYRCFLPQYATRRRDRVMPTLWHNVVVPLWPGYLFVHHDSRNSWRPIYETPGVRSVLKHHDQIQWAPHGLVDALQATEDARRYIPPAGSQWAPGMAVSLATGPFHDHPGVVVSVTRGIAHVALMLFGCVRDVSVSVDCLVARE